MADAAQQLQEAYQQIENGNLQEARELLEDIRPQNENNPDFWWVYAHALEDATEGRNALSRVRQLAPNYPGLQNVEQEAGIRVAQSQLRPLQRLGSPAHGDSEDLDIDFDDMDEESGAEASSKTRNLLMGVLGFAVLLIIIVAILSVSGILGGGGAATPTELVAQDTAQVVNTIEATGDSASVTVEVSEESATDMPTEEIPTATDTEEAATATPEPTEIVESNPFAALYPDLAAFGVPEDGISIEETSLGNSLIVNTCSNPGPAANNNIIGVMDVFAAANVDVPEDVEAVTFNITNCDTNTVTIVLGLRRDTLVSYLAGDSSASELLKAMERVA